MYDAKFLIANPILLPFENIRQAITIMVYGRNNATMTY
jgi:hypothetical protein